MMGINVLCRLFYFNFIESQIDSAGFLLDLKSYYVVLLLKVRVIDELECTKGLLAVSTKAQVLIDH